MAGLCRRWTTFENYKGLRLRHARYVDLRRIDIRQHRKGLVPLAGN
jgi:hypothetical protein